MELGAFSVSRPVRNLPAARDFYLKLGFVEFGGDATKNRLILRNGSTVIGPFQGMFEGNMLTFNPGWDGNVAALESFTDIRELQRDLTAQGIEFVQKADKSTSGPASFVVVDPDGNPIPVDRRV